MIFSEKWPLILAAMILNQLTSERARSQNYLGWDNFHLCFDHFHFRPLAGFILKGYTATMSYDEITQIPRLKKITQICLRKICEWGNFWRAIPGGWSQQNTRLTFVPLGKCFYTFLSDERHNSVKRYHSLGSAPSPSHIYGNFQTPPSALPSTPDELLGWSPFQIWSHACLAPSP